MGRDIDGVFLLDKPQGMSSNDIMQKVKRVFQANKAGHTGALDPLATGYAAYLFRRRLQSFHSFCRADNAMWLQQN